MEKDLTQDREERWWPLPCSFIWFKTPIYLEQQALLLYNSNLSFDDIFHIISIQVRQY